MRGLAEPANELVQDFGMERLVIDALSFGIEMATPEICVICRQGERRRTDVQRVGVVNHRALAGRVIEQAFWHPHLQHALAGRRELAGLRERVPRAKPHGDNVARLELGCDPW